MSELTDKEKTTINRLAEAFEGEFMQPQTTHYQHWHEVETTHGNYYLDADLFNDDFPNKETLSEYVEGEIIDTTRIGGFGARLSASGYMDCTEWTVFDRINDAAEYLIDMYGND